MNHNISARDFAALEGSRRLEDGRWNDGRYVVSLKAKSRASSILILLSALWSRIYRVGWENFLRAERDKRPYLIVAWHGSLMIPIYCFRNRGMIIMTSLSQDGDLLTQVLYNLGFGCVRGSSSRGGMRGLLEMARLMKKGENGAITVDGPRGPRHEVKPGAVLLARKSGAQLVPIGLGYSSCYRLNNWDKTEIPVPAAKVVFVTGKPFTIPDKMNLEEGCQLIRERILECEMLAGKSLEN